MVMSSKKNILVISGSTREKSINLNLINYISFNYSDSLKFMIFKGLSELPHFNVDLDTGTPPPAVKSLRQQLGAADGILICTPEYAMGLPGSLKNLLDWTVSSSDFSNKPVAVITAATSGEKAHESLLGTLHVIEAKIDDQATLIISHAKGKITDKPEIKDEKTAVAVNDLMHAFMKQLLLQ
jgi:chromate reductase